MISARASSSRLLATSSASFCYPTDVQAPKLSRTQVADLIRLKQLCQELGADLVVIGAIAFQAHFPDFADDMQEIIRHRQTWNPPTWD